jgi:hypothetical protein
MEACEVVRLFVSKAAVPAEPKRRGNPSYGPVKAIRVLVYARLKELENDTRVVEHLKKYVDAAKTLGLRRIPDRTTIGRRLRRYLSRLEETFQRIANMLKLVALTTHLVADSTPLVNLYDMEAKWGFSCMRSKEVSLFFREIYRFSKYIGRQSKVYILNLTM